MVAPEVAPNVSARGADDVDRGDEVAQRGVSDAESVGGNELRELRRRNSPSDPTSWEIEDRVLTGHASFRSWCAACVQGRGRAERHQGEGRKYAELTLSNVNTQTIAMAVPTQEQVVNKRWIIQNIVVLGWKQSW